MRAVGITGAGGYIGQRLIAYLEEQDWCTRILATDIQAPTVESSKLTFLKKDIREPSLLDFWRDQDVTTVVHLAFVVDPMHDEKLMYDINVNGTLNVLKICEELEVGHVIVASSGTAYGAWPDNPEVIREDDPIRVFPPKFSYAHHKGLVEGHCAEFIEKHPDVIFNIVRPCVVYGPNTDNYLSRLFGRMSFIYPGGRQGPSHAVRSRRRRGAALLPLDREEDTGRLQRGRRRADAILGDRGDDRQEVEEGPTLAGIWNGLVDVAPARFHAWRGPRASSTTPPIPGCWTPRGPRSCWAGSPGTIPGKPCASCWRRTASNWSNSSRVIRALFRARRCAGPRGSPSAGLRATRESSCH